MKKLALIISFVFLSYSGYCQFGEEQIISTEALSPTSISVADIDNDGDLDVLTTNLGLGQLIWFENNGIGDFGAPQIIDPGIDFPRTAIAADIDNDGDNDVVSGSEIEGTLLLYINGGNGIFNDSEIITNEILGLKDIQTDDVDNDGDLDLLVTSLFWDKTWWIENDGFGNFGELQAINGSGGYSAFISDVDGDGVKDLITCSFVENNIVWNKNDGNGNFDPPITISTEVNNPTSVFASDLDGDEDFDIISASSSDNKIAWYENDGAGNFNGQEIISTEVELAQSVFSIDLDGDNDFDVISASQGDNKIAWFENDGSGNFGSQQLLTSNADGANCVFAADIDDDGFNDVLFTSLSDNKIAWFENLVDHGCADPLACNYDSFYNFDNGSCCYTECGCTESNADNFSSIANCNDGSCIYLGCIEVTACNFDPIANTDNGSCILPDGCTDPNSSNYDSLAECNDGSCEYKITGVVFFDENEDGILNGNETGLAQQEVLLEPLNLIGITNNEGEFTFISLNSGIFSVEVISNESFPYLTTMNPINFNMGFGEENENLIFGVSMELPNFNIWISFYPQWIGYPCDIYENHDIYFTNSGNITINGIIELEYDTLFQDYLEVSEIDSVIENRIYMSFENLLPSQQLSYDVLLHTPTADYIGEFLTSTARVYGFYEDEQVAYGESILIQELTCSYDPNDKQVFPAGHDEEHYVLNDTELEYLVRFQNTGNAAAINVTVSDTIDENLDLSTFSLMANSHSVMTSINPETRAVDFFFENIMLPDSTTDEPGSHGLVSYNIRPHEELPTSIELNNTAYIYFDNNPAIITNTTWTTIYTCELFSASLTEDGITLTASEGVSYQWFLNGTEIEGATNQIYTVLDDGNYSVEVTNYFDCVELTSEVYIVDVSELEEAAIKLFPNPMAETSYLFFEENCKDCKVRLTASNGQLVREYDSITGNKLTIERKGLASGTYVLQVVSENESVKEFVLIMK